MSSKVEGGEVGTDEVEDGGWEGRRRRGWRGRSFGDGSSGGFGFLGFGGFGTGAG